MEARWPSKALLDTEIRERKEAPRRPQPDATNLRLFPASPEPKPVFQTALGQLVVGDCLDVLHGLEDETVDLVITSPPYDGQPKYGNGEKYEREWYAGFFLDVAVQVHRVLKPHGSFVLNYRSKRHGNERGTLQYELIFWLRDRGFLFCEDFVWGKPSPPPGRFNRFLKDAVEYCFQFAKTPGWQFFPEHCLAPARWDAKDRERRKRLAHNYERVNAPSGQGRKRVQAGPDLVRPSTLLSFEPEFSPNPVRHPARFPLQLPSFFIRLLSQPGQLVVDPFGGTGTTALAAEQLDRRWLVIEIDSEYAAVVPERFEKGKDGRRCKATRRKGFRSQSSCIKDTMAEPSGSSLTPRARRAVTSLKTPCTSSSGGTASRSSGLARTISEEIARRFGVTVRPAPDFVVFDSSETLRALLECKVANDGGTARDKAARFSSLRSEAGRLGGVPLFAVLAGLGWRRTRDALGPVVRDTDGRVFTLPTLADMFDIQPFPGLVQR